MKHLIADTVILFAPGIAGTLAIAAYVLIPAPVALAILLGITIAGQLWMWNHFRLWLINESEVRAINKAHSLPPDYHITK